MNYAVGYFGAAAMAAMLLVIGAVYFYKSFRRVGVAMLLIALGFLHAAATKPSGQTTRPVQFPYLDVEQRYLFNDGSIVSNDHVHVNFTPSIVLPSTAEIFLEYSDGTNTASWTTYTNATLATFPRPLDFDFPNAVSNSWMCYTTWTPGPTVHTNGVAQINWQLPSISGETNICAIINTSIYTNNTKVVIQ